MIHRISCSVLLSITLVFSVLTGCGGSAGSTGSNTQSASLSEEASVQNDDIYDAGGEDLSENSQVQGAVPTGVSSLNDVPFVMIYDPLVFNEMDEALNVKTSLNTGEIASQIMVGMNRADGLENGIEMPALLSQAQINSGAGLDIAQRTGVKAGGLDPVYSKGDRHDFYCSVHNLDTMERTSESFECMYSGESCYIWSYNGAVSGEDAEIIGQEFDNVIFPRDVEAFGQPRFTEGGGKVNILMYPMTQGLGGFFSILDIFAKSEVTEQDVDAYKLNTDHSIIHINSDLTNDNTSFLKSTLAHELQHQICASDCFYYADTPFMKTWLNEAMSAYAEEMVYPGIKEEGYYNLLMYLSDAYRKGQSIYNFDTESDEYIGVYGAVYLFSQYLENQAGEDIFSKIHMFWRDSFDPDITEASAIANSVPKDFYEKIDESIKYPADISALFESREEEWMSKLTLDFFRETLSMELAKLEEYEDSVHSSMLYSEMDAQIVQGGGRMIVATENGSFNIPDDADHGMIYIGLDENFHVIPELIIAGQ